MAIDPKLVSIIPASQLPTGDPTSAADFLFYEGNALKKGSMSNIYDRVTSGIKGEALTTTTPSATGYERYVVHTAGTYTNFLDSNGAAIEVTAADLNGNFVYLEVTDNVSKKEVIALPKGADGKTIETYNSSTAYVEGTHIFYEGKIYQVNIGGSLAGENPTTHPSKFMIVFSAGVQKDDIFGFEEKEIVVRNESVIGDSGEIVSSPTHNLGLISGIEAGRKYYFKNFDGVNFLKFFDDTHKLSQVQFSGDHISIAPAGTTRIFIVIPNDVGNDQKVLTESKTIKKEYLSEALIKDDIFGLEEKEIIFRNESVIGDSGELVSSPTFNLAAISGIEAGKKYYFENFDSSVNLLKFFDDTHKLSEVQFSGNYNAIAPSGTTRIFVAMSNDGGNQQKVKTESKTIQKKYIPFSTKKTYVNAEAEGARADGSDVTGIFSYCMQKLIKMGGGVLEIPAGVWNGKIMIPTLPFSNWCSINIIGEHKPIMIFGSVGSVDLLDRGTVLKPTTANTNPIIGVQSGDFSSITLSIENLIARATPNPNYDAIDLGWAQQAIVKNVCIDASQYSSRAIFPSNQKTGLITPKINNAALTKLENIAVQGFYNAIEVNEHTDADIINIDGCFNALRFKRAMHNSLIKRACLQRNTRNLVFAENDAIHSFRIMALSIEHMNENSTAPTLTPENAWQLTEYDIYDPYNQARGDLRYSVVKGYVGPDTTFTKLGGDNIEAIRI